MSLFSVFFNDQNFPASSDEDVQFLALKIRKAINFDVMDIDEAISDTDGIDFFNPLDSQIFFGAFEVIIDGIIESYVDNDQAFAAEIEDAFSVPMQDVVRKYFDALTQKESVGGNRKRLSYDALEENLMVHLDEAAQRISRAIVILTNSYECGLFHVQEIEDEPLNVRNKLLLKDLIKPEYVTVGEKGEHDYMVSLFHSFLHIDAEDVTEFLDDENYVQDMFRGVFNLPDIKHALQGLCRSEIQAIERSGMMCVGIIRGCYQDKYDRVQGYLSEGDLQDGSDMNEWARAITYSMREAAVRMAQTCNVIWQAPCAPKLGAS